MESFTTKIVDMMKAQNLFESQGGPIIMSQVAFTSKSKLFIQLNHIQYIQRQNTKRNPRGKKNKRVICLCMGSIVAKFFIKVI
jgi:hypothetical protein